MTVDLRPLTADRQREHDSGGEQIPATSFSQLAGKPPNRKAEEKVGGQVGRSDRRCREGQPADMPPVRMILVVSPGNRDGGEQRRGGGQSENRPWAPILPMASREVAAGRVFVQLQGPKVDASRSRLTLARG